MFALAETVGSKVAMDTTGINLPLWILVPLVIVCVLALTVGLIWVIRRFFLKNDKK